MFEDFIRFFFWFILLPAWWFRFWRRWLLLYKPVRPRAWVARIPFYLLILILLVVASQASNDPPRGDDWAAFWAFVLIVANVAFAFRQFSVGLERPTSIVSAEVNQAVGKKQFPITELFYRFCASYDFLWRTYIIMTGAVCIVSGVFSPARTLPTVPTKSYWDLYPFGALLLLSTAAWSVVMFIQKRKTQGLMLFVMYAGFALMALHFVVWYHNIEEYRQASIDRLQGYSGPFTETILQYIRMGEGWEKLGTGAISLLVVRFLTQDEARKQ